MENYELDENGYKKSKLSLDDLDKYTIHSLIARENISESTRLQALKELALDFDKGGFIDRAIETSQPDMIIHHSLGEPRLDYIKYLQAISIEFEKKYTVGFKNNSFQVHDMLLLAASMLGATFLESTFEISEFNENHLLDNTWRFKSLIDVIHHLKSIHAARGGYEARKITRVEKEMLKKWRSL